MLIEFEGFRAFLMHTCGLKVKLNLPYSILQNICHVFQNLYMQNFDVEKDLPF